MYQNIKSQQHIQYCKVGTCFGYSNHHQANISVHGHDMFSVTVWNVCLMMVTVTETCSNFTVLNILLCFVLYIGQTYRYSPEGAFYIFSQQIYLIIFLDFLSPSSSIPPQNVVYFLMLPFLVHKIFTFYINGVLNCKCPAPGPKG